MVICRHGNIDLRSVSKVQLVNGISPSLVRQGCAERATGGNYSQKVCLVAGRKISSNVFKKGKEARPEAQEKKFLSYKRIAYIIWSMFRKGIRHGQR